MNTADHPDLRALGQHSTQPARRHIPSQRTQHSHHTDHALSRKSDVARRGKRGVTQCVSSATRSYTDTGNKK